MALARLLMCRHTWSFAGRLYYKNPFLMCWLILGFQWFRSDCLSRQSSQNLNSYLVSGKTHFIQNNLATKPIVVNLYWNDSTTKAVFSEEYVCPPTYQTDLSLKKVISIIYLFVCVCMWSMGAIFQNLSPSVTLKMGSRSPKSNGVKVTEI